MGIERLIRKVSDIFVWVAGTALLAMVLVTVVDVFGRYVLGKPVTSGHALVQALVFVVVFLGLPLLSSMRGYMQVELLKAALPPGLARVRERLIEGGRGSLPGGIRPAIPVAGPLLQLPGRVHRDARISARLVRIPGRCALPHGRPFDRRPPVPADAGARRLMLFAIGLALLLVLLVAGVPIGFSMALVGVLGVIVLRGLDPAVIMIGQVGIDAALNYNFSVLPLFVLMGNVIGRTRMAADLYAAAHAFLGHRPGGLAMATIAASGGFAAVSGSSYACAATMTSISVPAMRKRRYDAGLPPLPWPPAAHSAC